ncbi:hypothetical protein L6452_06578 [Arctium lappa]|uniref:Uncharacterized protein n=1 Tax=Arctium lappa TaxID=4217 RepID=A0ACB9EK34_ARCLA|nr:hypothetical protein L6452_06578 [Arctium lappa]
MMAAAEPSYHQHFDAPGIQSYAPGIQLVVNRGGISDFDLQISSTMVCWILFWRSKNLITITIGNNISTSLMSSPDGTGTASSYPAGTPASSLAGPASSSVSYSSSPAGSHVFP